MQLETVVQETLDNLVKEGKVTKMIETHLTKTVDEIVKDCLREYSDFGKQVKQAVNSVLKLDVNNVKLLDLSSVISTCIREQLEVTVNENMLSKVTEIIKEVSGEMDKKEYNLSEIINKFKDDAESWDKEDNYEITLHVEGVSYGNFKHIYFDHKSGLEKFRCSYQLDIDEKGRVYAFKGGPMRASNDIRFSSIHGSFDKFIFRLYASGAKINIDNCDLSYEEEY